MKKITLNTIKKTNGYELEIDSFKTDFSQGGNLYSLPDNAELYINHENTIYKGEIAVEKGINYAQSMWDVTEYRNKDKIKIPENYNLKHYYSYGAEAGTGIIFYIKIDLNFEEIEERIYKITKKERNNMMKKYLVEVYRDESKTLVDEVKNMIDFSDDYYFEILGLENLKQEEIRELSKKIKKELEKVNNDENMPSTSIEEVIEYLGYKTKALSEHEEARNMYVWNDKEIQNFAYVTGEEAIEYYDGNNNRVEYLESSTKVEYNNDNYVSVEKNIYGGIDIHKIEKIDDKTSECKYIAIEYSNKQFTQMTGKILDEQSLKSYIKYFLDHIENYEEKVNELLNDIYRL